MTRMAFPQPHQGVHKGELTGGEESSATPLFGDILCAVDGTWGSMAAVEMAAALAGRNGHLTLLAARAATGSGPDAMAAIVQARAERILDRAKRIAEDAGVPATAVLDPCGPPVEVILERALTHDLVAMGPPPTSWLSGMLLATLSSSFSGTLVGGVAASVLSRITTPLLVVRRASAGSLRGRRVLVASDGEDGSDRLVEMAGRLSREQGARVTLVNALVAESEMNPRQIQEQAHALQRMLPDAGEPCIEPGKACDVILRAADRTEAALIVIGSRRLGGLRAFGSVSRRVIHDAPCSVLVVPPQNAGR